MFTSHSQLQVNFFARSSHIGYLVRTLVNIIIIVIIIITYTLCGLQYTFSTTVCTNLRTVGPIVSRMTFSLGVNFTFLLAFLA